MEHNLKRLEEDVSWMVEKFDYQNADADWKNSKDAIQRGMQKLKGGYPAAPCTSKRNNNSCASYEIQGRLNAISRTKSIYALIS